MKIYKKYKWNYKKLLNNIKILILGLSWLIFPLLGGYIIALIENIIK